MDLYGEGARGAEAYRGLGPEFAEYVEVPPGEPGRILFETEGPQGLAATYFSGREHNFIARRK